MARRKNAGAMNEAAAAACPCCALAQRNFMMAISDVMVPGAVERSLTMMSMELSMSRAWCLVWSSLRSWLRSWHRSHKCGRGSGSCYLVFLILGNWVGLAWVQSTRGPRCDYQQFSIGHAPQSARAIGPDRSEFSAAIKGPTICLQALSTSPTQ